MPKYNVHIYTEVRVKRVGIEAESQTLAIAEARKTTDLRRLLDRDHDHYLTSVGVEYIACDEEITGFMVDEHGDDDYQESQYYEADGVTPEELYEG